MRRIITVVGALMLVAAFVPGTANAQSVGEIMQGALNNNPDSDLFACGDGTAACNLHQRMYGDIDPREINGSASTVDGFPSWKAKPTRYLGDAQTTANYPNASARACAPWYSVWDGASNPNTSTYISYYAWQSTLINFAEGGESANTTDCTSNTGTLACFGAVDETFSTGVANSPAGALPAKGGLSPVPVMNVSANGVTGEATLQMGALAAGNSLNLPSKTATACPPAAAFNDLTDTSAPSAVWGVGLFFYTVPDGGSFRSLDSLEGGTLSTVLANPSAGMACTGPADCPGVTFLPCGELAGMSCVGDLMAPQAQTGTVTLGDIEAALGGPLGANSVAFVTKVFYRGSVNGSNANPINTNINPSMVSLFSAPSSLTSFNALAARVDITDLAVRGNAVRLAWQTVGSSYVSFTIQRANDGLTFVDLATVPATGASEYEYTDQLRGRRPAAATYRILAEDVNGNVTQTFESVNLSPAQGPRGR